MADKPHESIFPGSTQLLRTARCGCCAGKVDRFHLLHVRRWAQWPAPTASNIKTGEHGLAVAVLCQACAEARSEPVEVIEIREGQLVYHPCRDLVPAPPERTWFLCDGGKRIECLRCGNCSDSEDDIFHKFCPYCGKFHQG